MFTVAFSRTFLAVCLAFSTADTRADQPHGYWVQSSGHFDRFPFPPAVGGQSEYWHGRPWVTLRDPFGSQLTMPLQPKVLYYNAPFATPGGYYYPRSITMIPDDRRRAVPERVRVMPTQATYRYDGGPAMPVPPVAADPHR